MRKSVFTAAGVLAVVFAAAVFAGSLDQINPPSNAAGRMSTLTDIYNCLNSGTCNAKSSGGFAEPLGAPGITGHTLDEIMTLAKQRATQTAVPKSGQTVCYDNTTPTPVIVACPFAALPGQDGDNQKGVALPSPRFTHNSNGTVTDNLTGLIWLRNANCANVTRTWATALNDVVSLNTAGTMNSNNCSDTSNAGSYQTDWRLPNVKELQSLIDFQNVNPALPTGHLFLVVQSGSYWSATTYAGFPPNAWLVNLPGGGVVAGGKASTYYVWPVRGGQ